MTFAELKSALEDLDEVQLLAIVELRHDDVTPITIAQTHKGFPFFVFASTEDDDGQ